MSQNDKTTRTDEEWRQQLTEEQYQVTRRKGTERAFTGQLWNNKAAGFVAYGNAGGARAVEHLRGVCGELQMATVRQTVALLLATDWQDGQFQPHPRHEKSLATLFTQLDQWAGALKPLRTG